MKNIDSAPNSQSNLFVRDVSGVENYSNLFYTHPATYLTLILLRQPISKSYSRCPSLLSLLIILPEAKSIHLQTLSSMEHELNEYSCSVALGCNNMTICDILSPVRVSLRIRWSAHSSGAYRESGEQETTGTIHTQPPQYGSCTKDYLYKVWMIFSSLRN